MTDEVLEKGNERLHVARRARVAERGANGADRLVVERDTHRRDREMVGHRIEGGGQFAGLVAERVLGSPGVTEAATAQTNPGVRRLVHNVLVIAHPPRVVDQVEGDGAAPVAHLRWTVNPYRGAR